MTRMLLSTVGICLVAVVVQSAETRDARLENWHQWGTGTVTCSWVKSGSNMDGTSTDPDTSLNVTYLWGDRRNKGKPLLTESLANHKYGVNAFYYVTLDTKFVVLPNCPDVFDQPLQFYGKLRKRD